MTWCTYKVGVRPPTPKSGVRTPILPKITPTLVAPPAQVTVARQQSRHFDDHNFITHLLYKDMY